MSARAEVLGSWVHLVGPPSGSGFYYERDETRRTHERLTYVRHKTHASERARETKDFHISRSAGADAHGHAQTREQR